MGVEQLILFEVAGQTFGVDISNVYQIIKYSWDTLKIPKAPPFIDGLMNLNGRILTVLNLKKRLGFKNNEINSNDKIVIIEMDNYFTGFIVDNVTEIIRVDNNAVAEPPLTVATFDGRFLSGVLKTDKKLILLLDLRKILSLEEEQQIKNFVDQCKSEAMVAAME